MRQAAARIDHGHRGAADDEADIGNGVLVGGRGVLVQAGQHMDTGGDFLRGCDAGTGPGAEQRASAAEQRSATAGGEAHGALSLLVPALARGASLGR